MRTLQELFPEIERLRNHEAVRWIKGFRTWTSTYAELHGKVGAVIRYFDQEGIRKADRVLIRAENRMEWAAVFWACIARGIEAVPVDSQFSAELVERIRAESKPRMVIDDAALDRIAQWRPINSFSTTDVSPDDVVEIVYTSGTTGEPKGVVHRHRHICANLRPFRDEIAKYKKWARPFQPIRILDLLPLSHMFGQSLGLFIPVFLGGSVVFTNDFHPARVIEIVRKNRISVIVCVPRILENLKNLVARSQPPDNLSFWYLHSRFGWKFWAFVVGGARVDPDLEVFWKKQRFAVVQGYGLTEASPVVAVNHPFDTRTGSLGKVVPGQEVMIAPDGEILVRGESVTTTDGGWLHTGDFGEIDADGRLYFRGRKKDVIVTPEGLNVYPEDVEAVLNTFPEIRESAVIGTDHVEAVLILNESSTAVDELIRRANVRLESHQRIRNCTIWPQTEFPRTPSTLKLKRAEIARQLQSKFDSSPSSPTLPDLSAMSSLERVELLSDLENKYQVELDEEAFAKLTSTRELEAWLRQPDISGSPEKEARLSDWARTWAVRSFRTLFQRAIAMPLYRHYLELSVTGLENLNAVTPPVIFAANHTSHLDVPTIFAALPRHWRHRLAPAMMKDHFRAYFEPHNHSLLEIVEAALAYFLACALYNAYPLPQKMSGTRRALAYTGELVSRGYCPIVFPEGLRTTDGTLGDFRPGIGMMAERLRIPIIPIRLSGLYEIYSIHDSWPRRGRIRVAIGQPQSFDEKTSYDEVARRLREEIEEL